MRTIHSDKLDERTRRTTVSHPFGHEDGRLIAPEIEKRSVDEDAELSPAEHRVLADHHVLVHAASRGGTTSSPKAPKRSKLRTPRRKAKK